MIKKILVGLFILGMMCGAGFISAGPSSARVMPVSEPVTDGWTTPAAKSIICGGGC
jgi:hypothetical protein